MEKFSWKREEWCDLKKRKDLPPEDAPLYSDENEIAALAKPWGYVLGQMAKSITYSPVRDTDDRQFNK